MSKFIQITFGAASNGCSLYALDEDGNVWEYKYWSDTDLAQHWRMVSMEKRTTT